MLKKYIRVLCLVLVTIFIASGCSLISIAKSTVEEPTAAVSTAKTEPAEVYTDETVVAEYDGGKITRAQAMAEYDEVEAYYESYGYTLDDDETIDAIKSDILNYLCENEIVKAKAAELGLTTVTDEEKAELVKQAEAEYEEVIEYYKMYFEGETDEDTRSQVIDYLTEQDYTLESATQALIENAWQDKLMDYVCADLKVSEEDIRAKYDELVAADEENYSADKYSFEYAAMTGEAISWYPEGYRSVKHILIPFTDEQVTALSDKQMEYEDVGYYIEELDYNAENAETEVEPEADDADGEMILESDGETEPAEEADTALPSDSPAAEEELVPVEEPADLPDETFDDSELATLDFGDENGYSEMTREQLVAEQTRLAGELKAMQDEYYQTVADKVKEIQDKIAAGEGFEALIAEYGDDDGMTVEPGLSMGYLVSEGSEMFEAAFTNGAMAIAKVGDVSEPVIGTNGVHIIKYMSDITPGAVPFEQLKATVEENALETARDDMYYEAVAEWVEAANVVTYPERMK